MSALGVKNVCSFTRLQNVYFPISQLNVRRQRRSLSRLQRVSFFVGMDCVVSVVDVLFVSQALCNVYV